MVKKKYVILGAGITGLTLGKFLKSDFLILEKENQVGGYCKTIKKSDYIWDYAGHFFHFKEDYFKEYFLDKNELKNILFKEKNTKIFYKNTYIDYPFQKNIHQLEKNEFIECLYDLFTKEKNKRNETFVDMLYEKFGKGITDKFLRPYNEKLYACDLKNLDRNAMGRFFPYANRNEIIENMRVKKNISYNDNFLYPKEGANQFIDKIALEIERQNILLNQNIKSIDINKKIIYTENEIIKYEVLINTIPLINFIKITNSFSKFEKYFSWNKVLVFNIGFNKNLDTNIYHWIYYPDKELNYYRVGFYNNILENDKLSIYVEIGYGKEDKIDEEEIKRQLELTLENLKKTGIIDKTFKVMEYCSIVMDPAYVHINKEIEIVKKNLKKNLKEMNIYTVGRYGDWKYCSMEDSMLDAKNLVEYLKKEKI